MDLDGLIDATTLQRVRQAEQGLDVSRALRIGQLNVGDVGVLRARVASIAAPRTFKRKNGTEGLIGRVTFNDGTGEIEAALWDDANRLTRDGTLSTGLHVELRGVVVKEGWRGGFELDIEQAEINAIDSETTVLLGSFESISDTRVIEGRFQADLVLMTPNGPAHAVVWDELVKTLQSKQSGDPISLSGVTPHPLLDGWFLADGAKGP